MAKPIDAASGETAATAPEIWNIAASVSRDTSRLAGSNPTMMRDIVLTNRDVIAEQLLVTVVTWMRYWLCWMMLIDWQRGCSSSRKHMLRIAH